MSSKLIVVCCVALCGVLTANAQYYENFEYEDENQETVEPTPIIRQYIYEPQGFRVRRDVLGGQLTSNPNGGADALLKLQTGVGSENHNLAATVFAAGNTMGKTPSTSGAGLDYNLNGHGLSVLKTHTPGVSDTFTQNARLNLINSDMHKLDANVFKTDVKLPTGFEFQKTGGNFDYSNNLGHGATLGLNSFKNIGTQTEALGRLNLWTSQDKNTKVDFTAGGTRWNSGPFAGQNDFKTGFGLTSIFG